MKYFVNYLVLNSLQKKGIYTCKHLALIEPAGKSLFKINHAIYHRPATRAGKFRSFGPWTSFLKAPKRATQSSTGRRPVHKSNFP